MVKKKKHKISKVKNVRDVLGRFMSRGKPLATGRRAARVVPGVVGPKRVPLSPVVPVKPVGPGRPVIEAGARPVAGRAPIGRRPARGAPGIVGSQPVGRGLGIISPRTPGRGPTTIGPQRSVGPSVVFGSKDWYKKQYALRKRKK